MAASISRGPQVGAVVGFCAGLLVDLAPPADHVAGRWALALVVVGLRGGVDDLHARLGEDLQDAVHLLGRQLGGLHGHADVFGRDEAGLFTLRNEVVDLIHLGFARQDSRGHDWRFVISSVRA